MSTHRKKLFAIGDFLAVVGSDADFWLCKCRQHVYEGKTQSFWIQWLEKESSLNRYPIDTTYGIPKRPQNVRVGMLHKLIGNRLLIVRYKIRFPTNFVIIEHGKLLFVRTLGKNYN